MISEFTTTTVVEMKSFTKWFSTTKELRVTKAISRC
jgi:hypothetical protein